MCCIFTCFGWMIDLIQRFWTFLMSCCICSAVCCLLVISAMAGIALGYNYSLAEYIDLKESNVSIFLKRGIFDDEIADMQLRRANDEQNQGRLNARRSGAGDKGPDEETTVRSGRRLDDSVFDGGDQYKYEGSLMKLTAKPPFERTTPHLITEDSEMGAAISSYTKDTLDSLKAIQSVVDARRAYAETIRGPTYSPVPTYPFNEVERASHVVPTDQQLLAFRRMQGDNNVSPTMNPARLAVPDRSIGEDINWMGPLRQKSYERKFKEFGIEPEHLTFPSPITYNAGPVRPTPTTSTIGAGAIYLTKHNPITLFTTRPTGDNEISSFTKDPKVLSFKEKLMAENNRPVKKHKPSDEDYDYDLKGLPVRKRRSINYDNKYEHKNDEPYDIPLKMTDEDRSSESKLNQHNIFTSPLATYEVDGSYDPNNIRKQKLTNVSERIDGQIRDNIIYDLESTSKVSEKQNFNGSMFQNIFTHMVLRLELIQKKLSESPQQGQSHFRSSKNLIKNDNNDTEIREAFKNKSNRLSIIIDS
ncbi:unnamed protein product [Arctia plantaginis]|uniref:Uncharacterized protein n=1 Tax=Arctia plantaginis TaxID=874455 RepID=A0A8S1BWF3_ARCPL|nr:unnamed protein product [Arctia plantaginis]